MRKYSDCFFLLVLLFTLLVSCTEKDDTADEIFKLEEEQEDQSMARYDMYDYKHNLEGSEILIDKTEDNDLIQLQLDQVYYYIISLQLDRAHALIESITL